MRKLVVGLVALVFLFSCNNKAEISVMNFSEVDRQGELVEVCLCSFKKLDPAKIVVLDSTGNHVPIQLLYKGEVEPQSFVFPVTVKAGNTAVFSVTEGVPDQPAVKTNVRHASGRMDDIEGAIAPYSEGRIWELNQYDRYKNLDSGAYRSSYMLYYDSVLYDSHVLTAEVQVTLDAGSYLHEMTVRFSGDTTQLRLAAGIFNQDASYVLNGNPERGYVGVAYHSVGSYVGLVFLNRLAEVKVVDNHIACISHYMQGESFRYFAGGGSSTDGFTTDEEWFDYLSKQHIAKSNPLDVKLVR